MGILKIGTIACFAAIPSLASATAFYADCLFTSSASARVPFNGDHPVFAHTAESLALQIEDEIFEDNSAVLVVSHGESELRLISAPFATSYVDGAVATAVTAITIYWNGQMPAGDYPAAYIKTSSSAPPYDASGFALPTLMTGRCRITRG